MKLFKSAALAATLCLAFSVTSRAQVCGDANGNGSVNLVDVITTLDYVAGSAAPINLANADCDGIPGVTISDVSAVANKVLALLPVDCTPSGAYSFLPAPNDTIFVPKLLNIPDYVVNANLLVFGSFISEPDAVYLPVLEQGAESNEVFELISVVASTPNIGGGAVSGTEARVLFNVELPPNKLNTDQNLVLLKYQRVSAGIGNIAPEAFDRPDPWFISIARDNDLVVPTIQYYEVTSPTGGLELSANSFNFHALSNAASIDTFTVDITQGPYGVAFEISESVPWLTASQYSGVTPATIIFLADAAGLGVYDSYTGLVNV
ncbi:MAG TPA: dockerin type I repeat-containing protein, partial [candidate division Zixibacteria bacterium]|nr:dockerin type I repeat-containing protein [candidate division Zixibacteria bacterium]